MKIILKKYYMPLILSLVSVLLIALLRITQNIPFNPKEICVWLSVMASTLIIRTIDDLLDYKYDLEDNKKVIPIYVQWVFFGLLTLTIIVNSFISDSFVGLALGILYIFIVFYAHKSNGFLKFFIYPILFMINFIMVFSIYAKMFNLYSGYAYIAIVLMISIIGSVVYGLIKRGKQKWNNI